MTDSNKITDPKPVRTEIVPAEPVYGTVCDCKYLNVRKAPSLTAEVLCTIPAGTKVKVEVNAKGNEWVTVITPKGITGKCMKKYIKQDT